FMLDLEQIERATAEELQGLLKFFRRDIRHAESWLWELKHAEWILENTLRRKIDSQNNEKKVTALKKQLLKSGLNQRTLAKKLGVSPAAVSLQVKTGIRMAKVAAKYAEALNCDPHSLLDF
ncbi:MAG: helix-turn-helix transcriptional regulator, partial [Victivallales bacterium]|nr:helix-turn-helix transcriptional regulator [Victivallales bacterium]